MALNKDSPTFSQCIRTIVAWCYNWIQCCQVNNWARNYILATEPQRKGILGHGRNQETGYFWHCSNQCFFEALQQSACGEMYICTTNMRGRIMYHSAWLWDTFGKFSAVGKRKEIGRSLAGMWTHQRTKNKIQIYLKTSNRSNSTYGTLRNDAHPVELSEPPQSHRLLPRLRIPRKARATDCALRIHVRFAAAIARWLLIHSQRSHSLIRTKKFSFQLTYFSLAI